MKKTCISILASFALSLSSYAQSGINIGAFIGVPIVTDGYDSTLTFGLDGNYLFEITDKILVGPAIGFGHSLVKEGYGDDFQYMPIAAAGRFNFNEKMSAGIDLGYGIGINDGNDGGVYIRPVFGYNITEQIQLNASFRVISLGNGLYDIYDFDYDDDDYYYGGTFAVFSVGATVNL